MEVTPLTAHCQVGSFLHPDSVSGADTAASVGCSGVADVRLALPRDGFEAGWSQATAAPASRRSIWERVGLPVVLPPYGHPLAHTDGCRDVAASPVWGLVWVFVAGRRFAGQRWPPLRWSGWVGIGQPRETAGASHDCGGETTLCAGTGLRLCAFGPVHSSKKCPQPELAAGISRFSLVAFYIPGICGPCCALALRRMRLFFL
jgi:hypothetical protein